MILLIMFDSDVLLGGGRRYYFPDDVEIKGEFGKRQDGQNFVAEWESDKNLTYISTRKELLAYKPDDKNLIGVFAHK